MKVLLLIFLLYGFSDSFCQTPDYITFYTEHFPPFNYEEGEELKGLAVDVIEEIFIDIGSEMRREDIILLPWSRAYNIVLKTPNTCLFTTVRSKQRESLFKWVGPIKSIPIVLIAKKNRNIQINTIDDLNKYKIVVVRNDIGHNLLIDRNISEESLFITTFPNKIPLLLHNERVDIWAYGEESAFNIINKNDFYTEDYEVIFILSRGLLNYYAFNIDTSDEVIRIYQNSLDKLKDSGIYQSIIDSYKYQ